MNYATYFHSDQRIKLRVMVTLEGAVQRYDSLFGQIVSCNDSTLEISFPPPHEEHAAYPFASEQPIEVLAERHGMGLCAQARFIETTKNSSGIRLSLTGDLNYFNRRLNQRIDTQLWMGLEQCTGSIRFMKGRWQQLADHFRGESPSPNITDFCKREISLSATGMGINDERELQKGDYFLVFLALEDNKQIICILGEVVRTDSADKAKFATGIHFDCILEDDRKSIERFVAQNGRKE